MQPYDEVLVDLRAAYDDGAARRDARAKPEWKLAERQSFLDRLREAGASRLIEVGAGSGQDSAFFAAAGLDVIATDLSPAMIELCRAKGLRAQVSDVLSLDFPPASFDAVYTTNCLLHVPDAVLPAALARLAALLKPGGLMYLGVWGGEDWEGEFPDDDHVPRRFFAFRSDDRLRAYVAGDFEVLDFHTVTSEFNHRYQSLTLRRRPWGHEPA